MHMGSIVTKADPHGVQVKDHDRTVTRYQAGTILWIAGIQAPALAAEVAKATGAEQDRAESPRSPCRPAITRAARSPWSPSARPTTSRSSTTTWARPLIFPAGA